MLASSAIRSLYGVRPERRGRKPRVDFSPQPSDPVLLKTYVKKWYSINRGRVVGEWPRVVRAGRTLGWPVLRVVQAARAAEIVVERSPNGGPSMGEQILKVSPEEVLAEIDAIEKRHDRMLAWQLLKRVAAGRYPPKQLTTDQILRAANALGGEAQ